MRQFLILLVPMIFLVGCTGELRIEQPEPVVVQPEVEVPEAKKIEVLVFTAKWCAACQRDKAKLKELRDAGANITEIDIDDRPDLARQYQITMIPTYVVLEDGVEIQRTGDIFLIISIFSLVMKILPYVWPLIFG